MLRPSLLGGRLLHPAHSALEKQDPAPSAQLAPHYRSGKEQLEHPHAAGETLHGPAASVLPTNGARGNVLTPGRALQKPVVSCILACRAQCPRRGNRRALPYANTRSTVLSTRRIICADVGVLQSSFYLKVNRSTAHFGKSSSFNSHHYQVSNV